MSHRPGAVVLRRETDGETLSQHCVLADTLWRRVRGMLGRRELEPGEGMVLRPSWTIHTYFMRFAIDVVFVDADQVVIRVINSLRPWRGAVCRGARDVIELRAGECARLDVRVGDRLAWAAQPESPPVPAPQSVTNHRPYAAPSHERTHVVLGTEDDRFLRLARFLLTRSQLEVEVTKRLVKVVDLVERHKPEVVVIDATTSLGDAARAVAAMEAVYRNVAVIVLYDGDPPRWTAGLTVSEKWESLETLGDVIQRLAEYPSPPAAELAELTLPDLTGSL